MKRKNLLLKNTILLLVTGVLLLLILHTVGVRYYQSSIGKTLFQTVEDTLIGSSEAAKRNKLWESPWKASQLAFSNDVSVLYMVDGEVSELNTQLTSNKFSMFMQKDYIRSKQWGDQFTTKSRLVEPVQLKDRNDNYESIYLLVEPIPETGGLIILSKDMTVYDRYLRNDEIFFIFLLLLFVGIILYFYLIQQRRIYEPVIKITEAAYQYAENSFDNGITNRSNDEIGDLATAVMKLGKALEASSMMNNSEKILLQHVFNSLPVGVMAIDENNFITNLNELGKKYERSFIRMKSETGEERFAPIYERAIIQCRKTKKIIRLEVQHDQNFYDVFLSPVMEEEGGELASVLLMMEETTKEKRLLAMREELITNVSHDFRTPLSTIKGYSEAIMDDIAETIEEKNEMAQIIYDEATQLNDMITKQLDFSRIQAGYSDIDVTLVDLKEFFERIKARFTDNLSRNNIWLTLHIEDGIRYVAMDEERMHQAIYNLIDNAIRYAADPATRDQRFIEIEIKRDRLLEEITIEVSDNGIGISEEGLPFIFERFYKDDKSRTRPKTNSSGIGLSLVQSIIEKHRGTIMVKSKQDVGTTFTIHMPYKE